MDQRLSDSDIEGAVIADMTAATDPARFHESPSGLDHLDRNLVFARYWTHPEEAEQRRRKAITQAEVLVPDQVGREFVLGIYVSCAESKALLVKRVGNVPIRVRGDLFFQTGSI